MWRLPASRHFFPALARRSRPPAPAGCRRPAGYGDRIRHQSTATAAAATISEPPHPIVSIPNQSSRLLTNPAPRNHDNAALINGALEAYYRPSHALSEQDVSVAWSIAARRSKRPSVVTAQMILYTADDLDPDLRRVLPADHEWDLLLAKLEAQGFEREELFDWVHILVADTPEERIQRFLTTPRRKPAFLLNYLLNDRVSSSNGQLMSAESLYGLIEHCKSWYGAEAAAEPELEHPQLKSWSHEAIAGIFRRLLSLARRIQPKAVVDVANLAAMHLNQLATYTGTIDASFRADCRFYNLILQQLSIAAPENPYASRHFSWQGMLKLLSLSSARRKPLIIERRSYRAIRGVLLGIRKADSERDTATALKDTWPPYRTLRDGVEEAIPLEEYHSRTVKAGTMMQEAGYSKQLVDLATDVLGGLAPDGSPTLQVRTNFPAEHASPDALWAAQVKATRNPEEAWRAFQRPPADGMKPGLAVYEELVHKIMACENRPLDKRAHDNNLPGDGRETVPFNDFALSDFEKARLKPPSLSSLVQMIFDSGIRLQGRLLNTFIRFSPDVETAVHYTNHSALFEEQRQTMVRIIRGDKIPKDPSSVPGLLDVTTAHIQALPTSTLHALVDMLCRWQEQGMPGTSKRPPLPLSRVTSAYRLALHCDTYRRRSMIKTVLSTLSRPNVVLSNGDARQNAMQSLIMSGEIISRARSSCGINREMFQSFARTVQKAVSIELPDLIEEISSSDAQKIAGTEKDPGSLLGLFVESQDFESRPAPDRRPFADWPKYDPSIKTSSVLRMALRELSPMWQELAMVRPPNPEKNRANDEDESGGHQAAPYAVTAHPLIIVDFMRTLAFLGAFNEMARLLRFTRRNIVAVMENAGAKDAVYIARAVYVFRAFAEPELKEKRVRKLRDEVRHLNRRWESMPAAVSAGKQVPMYWPSDEEVREFADGAVSEHWRNLETVFRLLRERREQEGDGGDDGAMRARSFDSLPSRADEAAVTKRAMDCRRRAESVLVDVTGARMGLA